MTLSGSNVALNVERSMNRFLKSQVRDDYMIYFSERAPDSPKHQQWLEMNWVDDGHGRGLPAILQIDCKSRVADDPMSRKLKKMRDFVIDKMNVAEIPLYDYTDEHHGVVSDIPIAPRLRGNKRGIPERQESIAVIHLTYNLYVWRPDILP